MLKFAIVYLAVFVSICFFNIFTSMNKNKVIVVLGFSLIISSAVYFANSLLHINLFLPCVVLYSLIIIIRTKGTISVLASSLVSILIVNCVYDILSLPINSIYSYSNSSLIIYIGIYAALSACIIFCKYDININNIVYILGKSTRKQWTRFIVYFALALSSIVLFDLFVIYIKANMQNYGYSICRMFLYAIYFVFFLYILVILLLSDLLQASMISALDSMYKTEINDFFKVIRSQRHDYSFHLQAVYGLLAQKQYNKCLDYVKSVVADTQKISELIPISEIAISSMIMSFKQKAEQTNIVLNLSVEYNLDNICCSVYEINRIIGNLLQNALDETDMHKENRAINLFILKRMGMAIIRVENPIDELHMAKEDMYKIGVTSKDRISHEGIGMSTIKSIIEKYNGKIHIDFENGLIIISVYMPLK